MHLWLNIASFSYTIGPNMMEYSPKACGIMNDSGRGRSLSWVNAGELLTRMSGLTASKKAKDY